MKGQLRPQALPHSVETLIFRGYVRIEMMVTYGAWVDTQAQTDESEG